MTFKNGIFADRFPLIFKLEIDIQSTDIQTVNIELRKSQTFQSCSSLDSITTIRLCRTTHCDAIISSINFEYKREYQLGRFVNDPFKPLNNSNFYL